MTLPEEDARAKAVGSRVQSLRVGWLKTILYIVFLAVSLSVLDLVFGWTPDETIPLEAPPASVKAGSLLVFTGMLLEAETGRPVANANIRIMERDIGGDDPLASGTTGEDGGFSIEWKARKTDLLGDTAEVYAKFDGDEKYQPSKSELFIIKVEGR